MKFRIWQTAAALAGTYGLCSLLGVMGVEKASYSIFGVIACGIIWMSWGRIAEAPGTPDAGKAGRKRIVYSFIVCFLFSLSMFWGYQLQNKGMTDVGAAGKGKTLLLALCLAIALLPIGNFLFRQTERLRPVPASRDLRFRPAAVFGVCAAAILLCLIPVWLAYYPVVMSYEFHRQVNEAHKGFAWFYPYQPIAHTWLIWLFLQLGTAVGSLETGFACMAVFQMALYALVTGYACCTLYRMVRRLLPVVIAAVFFGVFPLQSVIVVCTTKDSLFTTLFLLFFLLFLERSLFCGGSRKKIALDVLLVLEGCLMMQFRNNAFYAVAVFMILLVLLTPGKERLRMLLLCVLLIAGGRLTQAGIKAAIGTELTLARVEMFSVPIQQIARVGHNQKDNLDPQSAADLDKYLPRDSWDNYYPPLADTMKSAARFSAIEEDYGSFFSFWLGLGLRYPNDYLDAFLELTRGYWFWDDVSWAENLGYGVEGRMGAVFTYTSSEIEGVGPVLHESRFPWLETQLEKIVSGNAFYRWPVLSVFFKCAFYTWALFLLTMACLYRKRKTALRFFLLPWLYLGTILLGPVVWIRYLFPIMALIPLLCGLPFVPDRAEGETI